MELKESLCSIPIIGAWRKKRTTVRELVNLLSPTGAPTTR
jgi:hypothetical protein